MPLASVDAVQLTRIELADCAVAVTPAGIDGGVVSAGGGGDGGGGLGAAPLSPPPPHADKKTPSDATVASTTFRFMPIIPDCSYSPEAGQSGAHGEFPPSDSTKMRCEQFEFGVPTGGTRL
jgi:hypothetical protein